MIQVPIGTVIELKESYQSCKACDSRREMITGKTMSVIHVDKEIYTTSCIKCKTNSTIELNIYNHIIIGLGPRVIFKI